MELEKATELRLELERIDKMTKDNLYETGRHTTSVLTRRL
jgi:hypothetical protein